MGSHCPRLTTLGTMCAPVARPIGTRTRAVAVHPCGDRRSGGGAHTELGCFYGVFVGEPLDVAAHAVVEGCLGHPAEDAIRLVHRDRRARRSRRGEPA